MPMILKKPSANRSQQHQRVISSSLDTVRSPVLIAADLGPFWSRPPAISIGCPWFWPIFIRRCSLSILQLCRGVFRHRQFILCPSFSVCKGEIVLLSWRRQWVSAWESAWCDIYLTASLVGEHLRKCLMWHPSHRVVSEWAPEKVLDVTSISRLV